MKTESITAAVLMKSLENAVFCTIKGKKDPSKLEERKH
jgi:hypothetical protein